MARIDYFREVLGSEANIPAEIRPTTKKLSKGDGKKLENENGVPGHRSERVKTLT
jgi:hypothetical protein